jgi:hypothetical protein
VSVQFNLMKIDNLPLPMEVPSRKKRNTISDFFLSFFQKISTSKINYHSLSTSPSLESDGSNTIGIFAEYPSLATLDSSRDEKEAAPLTSISKGFILHLELKDKKVSIKVKRPSYFTPPCKTNRFDLSIKTTQRISSSILLKPTIQTPTFPLYLPQRFISRFIREELYHNELSQIQKDPLIFNYFLCLQRRLDCWQIGSMALASGKVEVAKVLSRKKKKQSTLLMGGQSLKVLSLFPGGGAVSGIGQIGINTHITRQETNRAHRELNLLGTAKESSAFFSRLAVKLSLYVYLFTKNHYHLERSVDSKIDEECKELIPINIIDNLLSDPEKIAKDDSDIILKAIKEAHTRKELHSHNLLLKVISKRMKKSSNLSLQFKKPPTLPGECLYPGLLENQIDELGTPGSPYSSNKIDCSYLVTNMHF